MSEPAGGSAPVPATMRALRFSRHGGPEVLAVEPVPVPVPRPDEVLVEVHAAGLNPSDAKNVAGAMRQTTLPRIPGRDFAGRVVGGVGPSFGAEVAGTSGRLGFTADGTHAAYVVTRATAVVVKPAAVPMAVAAAVGVPFVTALEGLERAALQRGERALVVGAGAVGQAAVQLARWRGARVAYMSQRGAAAAGFCVDVAFVPSAAREALARAGAPDGFDVVFDTVGATFDTSVAALARGGRLVVVSAAQDPTVSLDLRDFYRRDLRLIGLDSLKLAEERQAALLTTILDGLATGAIAAPAPVMVPLEDAREAYGAVLRGARKHVFLLR